MKQERIDSMPLRLAEDEAWVDFMSKPRGFTDITDRIFDGKIDDKYFAVCCEIVLTPKLEDLDIYTNLTEAERGRFLLEAAKLWEWRTLSFGRMNLVSEIVERNISSVEKEKDPVSVRARKVLNLLIPILLSWSEAEKAEKLFSHFKFEDRIDIFDEGKSVAYDPLWELFLERNVSLDWKRRTIEKVHERIKQEEANKKLWTRKMEVSDNYSELLYYAFDDSRVRVPGEFLLEEFSFLVEHSALKIQKDRFYQVWVCLKGKEDLKKKFFFDYVQRYGFSVGSENEIPKDIALQMAYEFSSNKVLAQDLKEAVEKFDREMADRDSRVQIERAEEVKDKERIYRLRRTLLHK